MIWALMAAVIVVVIAVLLWPLLRAPRTAKGRIAYDMAVFQDQLKEVDRDVARNVLTEAEAAAARIEIQRRILAAGKAAPEPHRTASRGRRIALAGGVTVAVPALALAVYLSIGAPYLVGQRQGHADDETAHLLQQLADRVAADPTNAEGITLLARSYRQMGRWDEAAKAYEQLLALKPDADTYASYGEVLTAAANGTVTPAADAALMKALSLDSTEPRSRFYLGLEQAEKGNARDAIAIWRDLTATAPADAPWLDIVRQQMAQVAQEAGIPPMTVQPRHPLAAAATADAAPVPTAPSTTALSGGFSPEQQQMIQGMVGGLAARLEKNPEDFDGWMMLGRSYTVLQKPDDAAKAYEKAVALKPTQLEPKLQLAEILMSAVNPDGQSPMPPRLIALSGDILKLDPAQPHALYVAGLARAKAGDKAAAKDFWNQAQKALPADAPLRADIERRLKALN